MVKCDCEIPYGIAAIQAKAFENSCVQTVVLPKNLQQMSIRVFSIRVFVNSSNLRHFEIGQENTSFCSVDGVLLHNKDGTALVRFPTGFPEVNYIIRETVAHIEEGAFSGVAKLEMITFTSNLKIIGARAFENCRRKLPALILSLPAQQRRGHR